MVLSDWWCGVFTTIFGLTLGVSLVIDTSGVGRILLLYCVMFVLLVFGEVLDPDKTTSGSE